MFSPALTLLFTVAFLATAGYSLVRLVALLATGDRGGSRVGELAHLLMSLAMLAMTWGLTGAPSSPGGALQIVVFAVLTVWFVRRIVWPPAGHERHVEGYHAAMCAAMAWMVAAMPALMGAPDGASGGHHHGGGAAVGGPPGWVTGVTEILAVVSLAALAFWLVRVVRRVPGGGCGPAPAVPDDGPGRVALATRPSVATVRAAVGPRLDAGCHLVMSAGMAVMLLVM
ncbi:DUF5134 domain-containing protein [Actinomycetospora soli]|uniref:DUF5134 domain-containing protein n=1 Tax=Actinomycetospora soli TaxID=2893887 RepID=UPI001E2A6DA3|nr:DUF5134 domain-containing protein [Actinomycetospora soli]MCD2189837.1 DUF5134 domain-containing protein [Actinomycetospora soli]